VTRKIDILDKSGMMEFEPRRLKAFVRALDALLPKKYRAPDGDLSIALFKDSELAQIHADFLQDASETDVITFEGDPEEDFAGEVCASAERAFKCAAGYGSTPSRELCLYVAHGYLHLAGIDDIAEADALEMREGEALALKILDKKFKKPIFTYYVEEAGK